MKSVIQKFLFLLIPISLIAEEEAKHRINFNNVAACEFLHFVSKICNVNFAYNEGDLDFKVTLVSGKGSSEKDILMALHNILYQHGYQIEENGMGYLSISHMTPEEEAYYKREKQRAKFAKINRALHGPGARPVRSFYQESDFQTYKLQYHDGSEIQDAIKQFSNDSNSPELAKAIRGMQYVKSTNSLLFRGDPETLCQLTGLIKTLDVPLRQVFIEVLVVETSMHNSLDFGLEWGAKANLKKGSAAASSTPSGSSGLGNALKNGADQALSGHGFDLSIIGDIIFHKGKSFLTLGALVRALESEADSTIILNHKIIAQDNKSSNLFVGDNIPFNGSTVQTIGSTQQTTSNIEYRKVGVSLSLKPKLGDDDIVSLEITQDVSQANPVSLSGSGIQTSEANMVTSTCVPDKCFLVVSGMIRNNKVKRKAGLPCLGGLPIIGHAFSRTVIEDEKRNLLIFVRPQIIHTVDDHKRITAQQELMHRLEKHASGIEQTLEYFQDEEPSYGIYPAITASSS